MTDAQRESISNRMKGNQYRLGKKHVWASKYKIILANRALRWWNNGEKEVRSPECPEGFVKGRISNKNKVWVNDGVFEKQIYLKDMDEFQKLGRITSIKGYKWFSTAITNFRKKPQDVDPGLIQIHRYYIGMVPAGTKNLQTYRDAHPEWSRKHPPKPKPVYAK